MVMLRSRVSARWLVGAAAALVCGSTLAVAGPVSAGPGTSAPASARVAGADRYTSAVAVANTPTLKNSCSVVLASGTNFPDGLSASILAQPVLLTDQAAMPAATSAELARRVAFCATQGSTINVTLVGGPAVISSAQRDVLATLTTVDPTRLAGVDRYTTAIAVANEGNANPTSVILAAGQNFPDALAGGVLAQNKSAPIILNDGAALRPEVRAYLVGKNLTLSTVYVLGGTTVMPASIVAELQGLGLTVTRLGGADRAATATAIAGVVAPAPTGPAGVVVVNGNDFPDALAAAPLAGKDQPILLVDATSIPAATAAYHVAACSTITKITAIGGTSVIGTGVVSGAVAAATCAAPTVASAVLTTSIASNATAALPTSSPKLNVTALSTGDAAGSAGNNWKIEIRSAPSSSPSVATQFALTRSATTSAPSTIVVTPGTDGNGSPVTYAALVDDWNKYAPAFTRFSMTAVAGSASTATDSVSSTRLAGGATNMSVAVTFANATFVNALGANTDLPVIEGLFTNGATAAVDLADPVVGTRRPLEPSTVIYTWAPSTRKAVSPPVAGLAQIRFAADAIVNGLNGAKNPAPIRAILTAGS
jgi:putative cell wall-binding protein